MEAQHLRLRVLGTELVFHDVCPDPSSCTELGDLLEQCCASHEEEGQPRGEVVDIQAGSQRGAHVLLGICQCERDLLHRRGPCLSHVIAGDRNGVPARKLAVAVGEDVADQAQRLLGRIDVGAASDVLLEHVILDRASQPVAGDALVLCGQLVHQQQRRGRCVDGHRCADLVQRETRKQGAHVIQGVDRHSDLADLTAGNRLVRVVTHLGRQVEGHRKATGAGLDQLVVALIGLFGVAEASVLAHCPRPARVHRRVNPTSEGELPRRPEPIRGVEALERRRVVDLGDR